MDAKIPDGVDEWQLAETPEDVAVLYSWANLKGAKYRDFSASRREYRAEVRHRAAEALRESELRAKADAESAATEAENAAREAEEAARFHEAESHRASEERRRQEAEMQDVARDRAMQHAAVLSQQAAAERVEAARRAEAVAAAEAAARREARELADARASALRQATRYQESEALRRKLAGPQPESYLPGVISDPYESESPVEAPGRSFHRPTVPDEDIKPGRVPRSRDPLKMAPPVAVYRGRWDNGGANGYHADDVSTATPMMESESRVRTPASYSYEPNSQERVAAVDQYAQFAPYAEAAPAPSSRSSRYAEAAAEAARRDEEAERSPRGFRPDEASGFLQVSSHDESGQDTPAWLHSPEQDYSDGTVSRYSIGASAGLDTLQESRERVASRWYALKGVFDGESAAEKETELDQQRSEVTVPVVGVFSLAGGVGKTSLVATLGRALSASGESVLLVDTTSQGLLPFYFGASELKPGVVRRFSPPPESHDAPIALVGLETMGKEGDATAGEWLTDELNRASRGLQRVLLDMGAVSAWVVRRLARMDTVMIVPVAPDMNSVITLGSVEKFFTGILSTDGRPMRPYYLLNGYDPSLPLHLDVREVMRQQLGDRLLPFVIRRSPSVSESLAEGMTVMDYAPEAPVANDYMNLASWLRTQVAPAMTAGRKTRWSER